MTEALPPDPTRLMTLLGGFAGKRLLCVGDVMVDRFVYGEVKRISPEAPVPVVRVTHTNAVLGGAGNVARNLTALGADVSFVSVIGNDTAGQEAQKLLRDHGALNGHVRVSYGRTTTLKTRYSSIEGHHLLRADLESITVLTPEEEAELRDAALSALEKCAAVILSDYGKGIFNTGLAAAIIAAAREAGKPVIVDPKGIDYGKYQNATVITPNRGELGLATNSDVGTDADLIAAAQQLRERTGAEAILVTRAGEGMTLVRDAIDHLPAESHEVSDVTGAGDTVVATLALAVAAGADLADAARLANIAAGIVVTRRGTAVASTADISAALVHSGIAGIEQKIVDWDSAAARVGAWRRQGLKVGFTNGCFDLLHPGHVALLRQARAACDRLIVGLNSDASVKRLKGDDRPIQSAAARTTVLASMASVDLVVVFEDDTPQSLIEMLRPDVLVKGADYARADVVGGDFVESYGGRVVLANLMDTYSTTATIATMKAGGTGQKS